MRLPDREHISKAAGQCSRVADAHIGFVQVHQVDFYDDMIRVCHFVHLDCSSIQLMPQLIAIAYADIPQLLSSSACYCRLIALVFLLYICTYLVYTNQLDSSAVT